MILIFVVNYGSLNSIHCKYWGFIDFKICFYCLQVVGHTLQSGSSDESPGVRSGLSECSGQTGGCETAAEPLCAQGSQSR